MKNKRVLGLIMGVFLASLLFLGLTIYGIPGISETSAAEEGKVLFTEKGCVACHGPEAQGTEIGPALPGHTAEQVRRQVRDPLSQMPPFTEEQISDAELDNIVAFITSLAPSEAMHMHEHKMSTPVQAHLWMALTALESDNATDTQHHLQHAVEVADGSQAEAIQAVLDNLDGGDAHSVQHELESVLAEAQALEEKTVDQLHLELAMSAMEAREIEDVRHHMEHFMEVASGVDKIKGRQVLALMDEEDLHEARHSIEGLMGMTPHADGGE